MQSLSMISLLVSDYDEAIRYFTQTLDFELLEDTVLSAAKRWVVVAPRGSTGARLLLAKAANSDQQAHVGNQTGGRVLFFLDTDDFERDHKTYTERGVAFVEPPRRESYGKVAVFKDLYGNKWDLVERKRG